VGITPVPNQLKDKPLALELDDELAKLEDEFAELKLDDATLCTELAANDAEETARLLRLAVLEGTVGAGELAPPEPPPQAAMRALDKLKAKTIFLLISDLSRV